MEIFRRTGFDKSFSLTTLILISFGLVIVFSSSAILSNEIYQRPFNFFIHQLVGACIGLALAIFVMVTKIPFYQSNIFIYGLLFLTFILLSACMFMPAIGHTNRWLVFFGLRFQPSELAKISLILFIAKYLSRKKENINELSSLAVPITILMIFILLIIKEPDYGTAILIFLICATMFSSTQRAIRLVLDTKHSSLNLQSVQEGFLESGQAKAPRSSFFYLMPTQIIYILLWEKNLGL
jgi:cell division protein FtsW